MTLAISRRFAITSLVAGLSIPAIVRISNIMPIRVAPIHPRKLIITGLDWDQRIVQEILSSHPLSDKPWKYITSISAE